MAEDGKMAYMENQWLETQNRYDSSTSQHPAYILLPPAGSPHVTTINLKAQPWEQEASVRWGKLTATLTVTHLPSRQGLLSLLQVLWGHKMPTALSSSKNKDNQNKWTCPINRWVHVTALLNLWPFLGAGEHLINYKEKEQGLSINWENKGSRDKSSEVIN